MKWDEFHGDKAKAAPSEVADLERQMLLALCKDWEQHAAWEPHSQQYRAKKDAARLVREVLGAPPDARLIQDALADVEKPSK